MITTSPATAGASSSSRGMLWLLGVLIAVLGYTFLASFNPEQALFANDGPLGAQASQIYKMPSSFFSIWNDNYWLGAYGGNYAPNITGILLWLLGPIAFNKFLVPISLLFLGLSAGYFCRQLRFKPAVGLLAGLAAALNSNFFSNACWGLSSRALSLGAGFLALAAIQSSLAPQASWKTWMKVILAGLAIGLSVSEGGDNGAIFSVFIAAYCFFGAWQKDGPPARRVLDGGLKVAVMAVFAAFLATQTVATFFNKDVQGTASQQSNWGAERQWNWATQWSLPKMESLRVLVPGLFGYRLDTPKGGEYWGGVGQEPGWEEGHNDPTWQQTHPQAFSRHSGAGEYAGVLVVLVALWALLHSFFAGGSYTTRERRSIWFWAGAAFVALLLSWGRHAPFYRIIYALPYFSTIRNPMKFMHPCHMCLMILFAYGLQGLWRRYIEATPALIAKFKGPGAPLFEKRWLLGSAIAFGLSMAAWLIYASAQNGLVLHLQNLAFDEATSTAIARFSAGEVGWSVFFLFGSLVLVLLIARGAFSGPRAVWATVLLGALLVVDLGRADAPWIKYYDYKAKYANNGVLQILADKPYEHRFAMPPLNVGKNYEIFRNIYGVEWLQHQFPYYNIQALDQPQDPRPQADKAAFQTVLGTNLVRLWELTNTRFLGGMSGNFVDGLNKLLDPVQRRFRVHTQFNFTQDETGNIGAQVTDTGPFALIEFTGALPRAQLFARWQVNTNLDATLARLASPDFDPHQEVLVANPIAAAPAGVTNPIAGTVEFASYAPKRIELKANVSTPALLLLNDRFDPQWNVRVDGQPAELLRANFCMRGVQLSPGQHTVEFRYQPQSTMFLVSLSATLLGAGLCVVLWMSRRRDEASGA